MTGHGPEGAACSLGFTLIEVVGAILLFSVALLMVIQLSGSVGEQLERSAINVELVSLAAERLDSLEAADFSSLSVGTDADTLPVRGESYARIWTISEYNPILLRISVSLQPVDGSGPTFSTESYKAGSW